LESLLQRDKEDKKLVERVTWKFSCSMDSSCCITNNSAEEEGCVGETEERAQEM